MVAWVYLAKPFSAANQIVRSRLQRDKNCEASSQLYPHAWLLVAPHQPNADIELTTYQQAVPCLLIQVDKHDQLRQFEQKISHLMPEVLANSEIQNRA